MEPVSIRISPEGLGSIERPTATNPASSFAEELGTAISKIDALQVDADRQATALARGDGNLHELALALETADIAMRTAVKVRNKLVDAYQEIMRMNI